MLTPPGYYSLDWASRPTPCNKGTYTPAGTHRQSELACVPCPSHTTTLARGAGGLAGCICEHGFFHRTPSAGICEQCPAGGFCSEWNTLVSTIRLEAGWWRVSNTSSDLRACPIAKPCLGNLNSASPTSSVCGPGVDPAVPYCSHCLDHPRFYLDSGSGACKACSESRDVLLAYIGALLLLTVGVMLWWRRCMAGSARLRLVRMSLLNLGQRISIEAKFKQLLGFYQIITHLHRVFGVDLPDEYKSLQRVLGIFSVDIFSLPGVEMGCFGLPSFASRHNFWALAINVMLVFTLFSCLMLEVDELVEAVEAKLSDAMRHRFNISTGAATGLLFSSTIFALVASVPILLRYLAERGQYPLLRWRSDSTVVEPPPTDGWHALVSHTWGHAQDQSRVLKERLLMMMPGLRLFLDVDDLEEAGGIGALEDIVGQCSTLLVFLSDGCEACNVSNLVPRTCSCCACGTPPPAFARVADFSSTNCLRELRTAVTK
jgi:hypothetical protein